MMWFCYNMWQQYLIDLSTSRFNWNYLENPQLPMLLLAIGFVILVPCHPEVYPADTLEPKILSTPSGIDLGPAQYFRYGIGVENKSFFQAHCGDHKSPEVNCKLSIEYFVEDPKNETRLRSYGFKLRKVNQNSTCAPYLQVFRLNEEKFIVAWIEYGQKSQRTKHVDGVTMRVGMWMSFVIISTKSGETYECRTFGTALTSNKIDWKDLMNSMFIHLRENEFGVTYLYSDRSGFAHEVFNSTGFRELGPLDGNNLHLDLNDQMVLSFPNFLDKNEKCQSNWQTQERLRMTALLGRFNHTPSYLMRLNSQYPGGYSTANNIVSACKRRESDARIWDCIQRKGKHAFKTLSIKFDYESKTAIVYSMPRGDLLTVTSVEVADDAYEVYLTVFDGSFGKAYIPLKLGKFPCSSVAMLSHIFQDPVGNYCFSLLPYATGSNFVVKCYSSDALFQDLAYA